MNVNAQTHPAAQAPFIDPDFRHDSGWRADGLPEDRLARVAARRAFVEMKQCFMGAAADAEGPGSDTLRYHVRQSVDIMDLWLLREALLSALPQQGLRTPIWNRLLREQLDTAFPRGKA